MVYTIINSKIHVQHLAIISDTSLSAFIIERFITFLFMQSTFLTSMNATLLVPSYSVTDTSTARASDLKLLAVLVSRYILLLQFNVPGLRWDDFFNAFSTTSLIRQIDRAVRRT